MIGKQFNKFKSSFSSSLSGVQSTKVYDITASTKIDATGLPLAPQSAFRKRPVKLSYDKNEYHMFRLPSEDSFLLGAMDRDEIFGKRKGITHSPHIQAQTDLDSNLLWLFAGATLNTRLSSARLEKTSGMVIWLNLASVTSSDRELKTIDCI